MSEDIYGPIITILCTGLFGYLLVRGFSSGVMTFEQPVVKFSGRRKDQPLRFWAIAALLSFLTAASAVATIGQFFFPNGIGG
ncbi:hypothetical protein [Sphingobium sp. AP50]|uniref:hypothetical protein n=1 Tax=Sphingobium sp. AP50 TaxID=1884369 RepID=UPI001160C39F|nr:hypothetical protein [Sphingobium sp. AP50]